MTIKYENFLGLTAGPYLLTRRTDLKVSHGGLGWVRRRVPAVLSRELLDVSVYLVTTTQGSLSDPLWEKGNGGGPEGSRTDVKASQEDSTYGNEKY